MKRRERKFYIVGESPLVEELAEQCAIAGRAYKVKINTLTGSKNSSKRARPDVPPPRDMLCAFELTNTDVPGKKNNLELLDRSLPSPTIIISSSVTVTATEQASWIKTPQRLVGISALPTLLTGKLFELAPTVWTSQAAMKSVKEILTKLKKEIAVVQDRVGMVLPRILCMLINEAAFAVMENIASPGDIDAAMKLGTNYPLGPIEWGNRVGIKQVIHTLDAVYRDVGEDRYRVSPLLRQLAIGEPWWKT
jgi:3-hydroxybutyryl-CoA dehydrogenase